MADSHTDDLLAEAPWLRRFAAGLARSAADADDLVQDTLSTALATGRGGIGSGPVGRGLLAGIARNLAKAGRRRDRRRIEREVRHGMLDGTAAAPAADEDARRLDLLRVLLDELSTLPPAQRRAITSRFLDELEPAEIAARDGVSPSSVRSQLSRGLAALRERMDQRGDGRDQWLGCLGPWAMGSSLLPAALPVQAAVGSGTNTSLTTAATHPTSLVAGAAGLVVMKTTLWLTSLVAIPALLAGLWWYQRDLAPGGPEGQANTYAESEPETPLAQIPIPEARSAAVTAAAPEASPATAPEVPSEIGVSEGSPPAPSTGLVVDMLTGEPVPHIGLEFLYAATFEGEGEKVQSDAQGRIEIDPTHFPATPRLRLLENDGTTLGQGSAIRQSVVAFPFEEPIPVHVGPTFTLDLPEARLETPWSISIRFRAVDDTNSYNDPQATIREGERPWVRFPRDVTELEGEQFELVFEDLRNLLTARVPVTRTRGIETEVIRPEFEQRGAARFVLGIEGSAQAPALKVDVTPNGHTVAEDLGLRALLTERNGDGTTTGTLRMLPPGNYTWTIIGAGTGASSSFDVLPGETTDVEIRAEALGATFDSEVLIDASAAPDSNVAKWVVMVTSDDEAGAGFMTRAVPVEGVDAQYRVALKALRHGTWRVVVQPLGGAVLEPGSATVTPGAPPQVLRLLSDAGRASLTLRVVDGTTGSPIDMATATVLIVPRDVFEFTPVNNRHSILSTDQIPRGNPTEIFVRAPGYRGEALLHDPERDGDEREIRLTPGWRSRVLVINVATMSPAAGVNVRVDGKDAGTTGADGVCWIEGDGPPLLIEVGHGHGSLEVVGTPYENVRRGESKTDPAFGFMFQMAPKTTGTGR